jgi:signal recognition particle subunit SRP54
MDPAKMAEATKALSGALPKGMSGLPGGLPGLGGGMGLPSNLSGLGKKK